MKTFKLYTLGCKVNQYETQAIREDFIANGFKEVNSQRPADIYVINSCTVTSRADSKSLELIRRARKQNHRAEIVLTGCLVNVDTANLRRQTKVNFMLNNQFKNRLVDMIKNKKTLGKVTAKFIPLKVSDFKNHSRAFVKIQDGCNNRCAYCKIPLVRGKSRSRPLPEIKEEVGRLVKKGFQEIVLTGICLGDYGQDLDNRDVVSGDLAAVIDSLEGIKGNFRIRLSSIEAKDVTDRLIVKLTQSEKLCPHLHIPFQSGDDEILRKMQRNYSVRDYLRVVKNIKKKLPRAAITTDIMVGFPGEQEKHFQNTLRFIGQISPSRIHVFPFSPRPETLAFSLTERVRAETVKKREKVLLALATEKAVTYYKGFINQALTVLTEHKRDKDSGWLKGYAENYIPVVFPGPDSLMGKLVGVKIIGVEDTKVIGRRK